MDLALRRVLNHRNACNQILRCLQRYVAGGAAAMGLGLGGEGAAIEG